MTTSDSNLNPSSTNVSVADELVQMGERDQAMRNGQEWDGGRTTIRAKLYHDSLQSLVR